MFAGCESTKEKSNDQIDTLSEASVSDVLVRSENERDDNLVIEKIYITNDSIEDEFRILLDDVTPLFNYYSQPIVIDGEKKIGWFNLENYSLDFYGIESKTLDKRIEFNQNGPNALPGIGLGAGINFVNQDSIIIYSAMLKRIYLTNISGKIYYKLDLSNNSNGFGSVSMESPIAFREGYAYMQIMPSIPVNAEEFVSPDYNRIAKIDIRTGEYDEFYIEFPKEYSGKIVSQQLKMMDIIYNKKIDKFIISYPLSDTIIVTDFITKNKKIVANSQLINDIIEIDLQEKDIEPSRITNYYYWINDSYGKLLFDPINNLYYREARKGISKDNYNKRNFKDEREFVILNSNFEQVGTFNYLSSGLYYYFFEPHTFFWNKDLQQFNLENGVEDSIFFHRMELKID